MSQFTGVLRTKYKFFSLAADYAGNTEQVKSAAEAGVFVTDVAGETEETPSSFSPGQVVEQVNSGRMNAGMHSMIIDMSRYSSGIYFYRIDPRDARGGRFVAIRKMMMIK